MNSKSAYKYCSAIGLCLLIGLIFHWNHLAEFPSYIHAWAQADHYSITLGFLDNGLNFFKPQTLMFNHQFPSGWSPGDEIDMSSWWTSTTETGITSVDFPIHHYIPALIMKVLGTQSPMVSRTYIFLYSLIGLFAIYKITYLFSKHHLRSLFVMLFATMSPVFVYYQAGFFPSIPSLSNTLLGVYFYFKYLQHSERKSFYVSIILLTLAALSRTTFVVPLIAVFSNEFLRIVFSKTDWKSKLLPFILSIGAIVGYFMYNAYLRETYSSIFIGYLLPPESWEDLWNVFQQIYKQWLWQYLSLYQYAFVFILIVIWILTRKKIESPGYIQWVKGFIGILLFGLSAFFIAMSHAYINHDYYFIDTFYLPVILLISLGCSFLPGIKNPVYKYISLICFGGLLIAFGISSHKIQKQRRLYNQYDMATFTKVSYEGSNEYLTELGISENDKILAIDVCAPNVPFVMMGRRGHGVFVPTKENIKKAFTWDFDYVVTQNGYFLENVYTHYPEIINHLTVIGNNGRITVSKYHKEAKEQSLKNYLFNGDMAPLYSNIQTFNGEKNTSKEWSNVIVADSLVNGEVVGEMKENELYGITLKEFDIKEFIERSYMFNLTAKVMINKPKAQNSKIVFEIKENEELRLSKVFELSDYIDENKTGTWQTLEIRTMLPVLNHEKNSVLLFLWNPEKDHLYVDDFKAEFY